MDQATEKTSVVDLSGANALPDDRGVLHTVFPGTNKPTGWDIVLSGPGHPKTVALGEKAERERLQRAAEIERAQVNGRKWKGDADVSPKQSRREFIESLVGRIISWTPVNFGSGTVTFEENDASAPARAVDTLLDPKLGAYVSQIVDYLLAERAFMKGSANV